MSPEEYKKAIVTINKEALSNLPAAQYEGQIFMVDKKDQVEDAIKKLREASIIGFDTETRPSFRRGQSYKVALIQLATPECCFLFRTNEIGYPQELLDLLEDPEILKIGLSIHDDFHNIRKVKESFDPQGFIDLQQFVKNYKIADCSLSRVYGILFGKRISKGQRLSNWEASELTTLQQTYAALDASACITIYNYLKEGKFNPEESKYLTLPKEPQTQDCNQLNEDDER